MKNVRIVCWWTSSENITKRTIDQFDINQNIKEHMNFVYDDSYDWLVVFGKKPDSLNFSDAKNYSKDRTLFFGMEPSWSPNTDKFAEDYGKFIFTHEQTIFTKQLSDTIFIIKPNYMLYGGRGDDNWNLSYLQNRDFSKSKKLSMVVTKRGNCWGTKNIYENRVELAETLLNRQIPVDMYGTFWENNNINIFGEIWNKLIPLESYEFSVAIENSRENNYITEKFYDCLLTDTIPIYCGAPNISDYFDPRGYIELKEIENLDACVESIIGVLSNTNLYNEKIQYCKLNKEQYLRKHNILLAIQDLICNA
jgi:hypothetical protein